MNINNFSFIPRALMLLTVAVALLGGLGSGLSRLGWQIDSLSQSWILVHGPLMISGFLGTLICLERAVALASRYRWSLLVPAVNALGAVLLLTMRDAAVAKFVLTGGSAGLVVLFVFMLRLHFTRDVIIMAAGALAWLTGNLLWLMGIPVYGVVHLWTTFLILTIVGERLELSRVRRLTRRSEYLLIVAVLVYLGGVLLTALSHYASITGTGFMDAGLLDLGIRVLGLGAVFIAAWLMRFDIARRTIHQQGLPRYIAACLLAGYVWLGFGGFMAMWKGAIYAGPDYALILHSFLLGFVFSMIFGHAPIIVPALTGLKLHYTPIFYGHLVLLHVSLMYRMYGNLSGNFGARQWGALLNVTAVLLFLGVTIVTLVRSNIRQGASLPTNWEYKR